MSPQAARFILSFATPTIFLLLLCLVTGVPIQARASTGWDQISTTTIDYAGLATSDTGQDVVYGDFNGDVWLSQDYGATFTDTLSGAGNFWESIAMSSDGQTILAGQEGPGFLWVTKNGGAGWTEATTTEADWIAVTMTSDGEHLAAITDSSSTPVIVSNDGGNTWTDAATLPNETWAGISYSEDGSQLVVTSSDSSGKLNVSTNNGASWSSNRSPVALPLGVVAAGDSGRILVDANHIIYESINGGLSWTDTDEDGDPYGWSAINFSYDHSTAFASPWSGILALSTDGGSTWTNQTDPPSDGWNTSAISGDGTHLYAAVGGSGIWRYGGNGDITPPVITILGKNPAYINVGSPYDDAGATAEDDTDGDVTGSITTTSTVNTAAIGTYTVTYVAHDSSDNYATSTRTVDVVAPFQASGGGGGSISQQVQNLITMGKTAIAQTIQSQWPQLFSATASATTVSTATPAFTRDLTLGSVGTDVRALQEFLNAHGFTVAAKGPGSAGQETMYFGTATRKALAKYQSANGIAPAAGYFGPLTRAYIASHH